MLIPESAYVAPIRPIHSGIRACTHLARVNLPGLSEAIVKAFPIDAGRSFFNEVAGGILAHHAGIGAPPTALIWIDHSVLGELFPKAAFHVSGGKVLCVVIAPITNQYGLLALGAGDTFGDSPVLREHLLAWGGLPACSAFDQWIGNIDRHVNNLLVGAGMRLMPIDHSDCFLGPLWSSGDFEHPYVWSNLRLDEVVPLDQWKLPVRAATVHQASRIIQIYSAAQAELSTLQAWLPETDGLNWINWIAARVLLTEDLLKNRLGMLH